MAKSTHPRRRSFHIRLRSTMNLIWDWLSLYWITEIKVMLKPRSGTL
ncbi:hypothetical protein [Chroococcidiopsis sp. SAG 2025]|nr:hypothetical protein [Chroococcidiopsis sp. SAG 2025]